MKKEVKQVKNPIGRPKDKPSSKLDEYAIQRICIGVAHGLSYKASAEIAGIPERTFHSWMRKAREGGKGLYQDLLQQVEVADAQGQLVLLERIRRAAAGGYPKKITTTTTRTTRVDGEIVEELITDVVTEWSMPPSLEAACWLLERIHAADFGKKQSIALEPGDNPFLCSIFGSLPGSRESTIQ